ncbi:1-aminocyclopropane-1-carboxylate deaminase/D-cysteine desulfhydrase [Micromonospora pisi]|uniref:1-aminocyclopropane-1-carboxylate deaminase/D-cysteine desulfhydrase n=1 Tax=Micromonospora pisi TaxID=589240 RepID=UPI001FE88F93|nr:pyridoxal-phosphate dependent enzyme [Micromonospora pisi]
MTGVADEAWWSREVSLRLPSPLTEVVDDRLSRAGVRLLLKRDDLIHPELPGNKWRKLTYNLRTAREQGLRTLVTFGGAYSNHVRAVAAAGAYFGFDTVGVIRGEQHLPLNPSLTYAVDRGMRLTYLDRGRYRDKAAPELLARLRAEFGEHYLIPEGGSNALAVRGCAEVPGEITEPYDVVCVPVGTGGTLAGIAAGLAQGRSAIGFSVLRGGQFLVAEVERLQRAACGSTTGNWRIEYDFHFGGYAKSKPELEAFIDDFAARHGVRLDRIYPAKMMYGLFALVAAGGFVAGTTIVAVVTG